MPSWAVTPPVSWASPARPPDRDAGTILGMSAASRRLLLATASRHKQTELAAILDGIPLTLLTPPEAGIDLDVDETGDTFEANARLKAEAFARASGLLSLAD